MRDKSDTSYWGGMIIGCVWGVILAARTDLILVAVALPVLSLFASTILNYLGIKFNEWLLKADAAAQLKEAHARMDRIEAMTKMPSPIIHPESEA